MTSLIWETSAYAGLFLWSLLAATLIPLSSEAVLFAAVQSAHASPAGLFAAATAGNVAGAVVNWWIGRSLLRWQDARWFPFDAGQIEAAGARFRRWGAWCLLLSWLPVIGDPLTLVAGVLRVPIVLFLLLVTVGKSARYAVVVWGLSL